MISRSAASAVGSSISGFTLTTRHSASYDTASMGTTIPTGTGLVRNTSAVAWIVVIGIASVAICSSIPNITGTFNKSTIQRTCSMGAGIRLTCIILNTNASFHVISRGAPCTISSCITRVTNTARNAVSHFAVSIVAIPSSAGFVLNTVAAGGMISIGALITIVTVISKIARAANRSSRYCTISIAITGVSQTVIIQDTAPCPIRMIS